MKKKCCFILFMLMMVFLSHPIFPMKKARKTNKKPKKMDSLKRKSKKSKKKAKDDEEDTVISSMKKRDVNRRSKNQKKSKKCSKKKKKKIKREKKVDAICVKFDGSDFQEKFYNYLVDTMNERDFFTVFLVAKTYSELTVQDFIENIQIVENLVKNLECPHSDGEKSSEVMPCSKCEEDHKEMVRKCQYVANYLWQMCIEDENNDMSSEELIPSVEHSKKQDVNEKKSSDEYELEDEEDVDGIKSISGTELGFFIDRNDSHNTSKQTQNKKDMQEFEAELEDGYIPFEGSDFQAKLRDYIVRDKDKDGNFLFNLFLPIKEYTKDTVKDFIKKIEEFEDERRCSNCCVGGTINWTGETCMNFTITPFAKCSKCDENKCIIKKFKKVKKFLVKKYLQETSFN